MLLAPAGARQAEAETMMVAHRAWNTTFAGRRLQIGARRYHLPAMATAAELTDPRPAPPSARRARTSALDAGTLAAALLLGPTPAAAALLIASIVVPWALDAQWRRRR